MLLFFVSILPFFGRLSGEQQQVSVKNELFTPGLVRLNSVDKMLGYCDSIYLSKHIAGFDTAEYVHTLSRAVREKFYHGLSQYTISENWIAYLSGKVLWSHLSAIVIPDDILKHSEGLCSQQTIVFMELLKRKHINVRSVGLGYKEGPGHFLCEVHYLGSWRLHDVTVEPQWKNLSGHHESMAYYLNHKDSLYTVYKSRMQKDIFDKITEKATYGKVNEFPAKNMQIFQRTTAVLTYLFPLFCLLISLRLYSKKRKKMPVQVPVTVASEKKEEEVLVV
jgi:hypothetical protein